MKPVHLALVRIPPPDVPPPELAPPPAPPAGRADASELALVASLFGLNLVPVVGEVARVGRWSPGIVGLATAAALLTGRELWSQLRARAEAKTEPRSQP